MLPWVACGVRTAGATTTTRQGVSGTTRGSTVQKSRGVPSLSSASTAEGERTQRRLVVRRSEAAVQSV